MATFRALVSHSFLPCERCGHQEWKHGLEPTDSDGRWRMVARCGSVDCSCTGFQRPTHEGVSHAE